MLRRMGRALVLGLMMLAGNGAVGQAAPACAGSDLIGALPQAQKAALQARADAAPFARGLFWQARKGKAQIILAGTYHFGDKRHDAAVAKLAPQIARAAALMVEAGPTEEARLAEALRADPTLMTDPTGPGLDTRLDKPDWNRLSAAMAARGTPEGVTARLRPWYVATMLGLSPCMLRQSAADGGKGGLDHRLIASAKAAGTPIRALEPWDTLFSVFAGMSQQEEIDMLRAALPQAEHADDYATTLTEAYFTGNVWMLWEFGRTDAYANSGLSRSEVDRMMELTRKQLMDSRNRNWIAPLTAEANAAAKRGLPVVAAFGALHLPGDNGVLRLLEQDGWTIAPLPMDAPT